MNKKFYGLEHHIHNIERWYGIVPSPTSAHTASSASMSPFVSTAGDDAYGNWTRIFGSNDLPAFDKNAKVDAHDILVIDVDVAADATTHRTQIGFSTDATSTTIGNNYTETMNTPLRGGGNTATPLIMPRISVGKQLWVRHWVNEVTNPTMSFFIGVHEYQG